MDRTLRTIRRVCSAGLDSLALRKEVVRRVGCEVPFEAFAFSTVDPDTGILAHTVADGIPLSLGATYVERIYPTEEAFLAMDGPRRGRPVISMADMSPEAQEAFRAAGLDIHVHASLAADARLWGTWCLMREWGAAPVAPRSRELIERSVPWIARGLKNAALVDEARSIAAPLTDTVAPGVVVLDHRHRPMMRTPLAARWLADIADDGGTTSEPDELPLSVVSLAARLRRTRTDTATEALLRIRGASGSWYILRASLSEPDASGASSVVVVIRPALRREVAPVLSRLYALSQREREVVAAVSRGESTKCIAASLGLSPHTVEEHLERACRKIGVRGRKALVAKLFVDGYAPTLVSEEPAIRSITTGQKEKRGDVARSASPA